MSIDGGQGTNTLQSKVVGGPPQAANNLVWGETGGQSGWMAGPTAGFLASGPFEFDSGALNGNSLYLPSNGFQTGQAVTSGRNIGGAIGGLVSGTVYYVISQGQNMIALASQRATRHRKGTPSYSPRRRRRTVSIRWRRSTPAGSSRTRRSTRMPTTLA